MPKNSEILVDDRGYADKGWSNSIHANPKKNAWEDVKHKMPKRPPPEQVYKRSPSPALDQSENDASAAVADEPAPALAPMPTNKATSKRSNGSGGFRGLVWSMVVPLQLSLFLYEYLAWQVDTEYTAVGEFARTELGPLKHFLLVQAVSWPHLLGALAFSQRILPLMMLYFVTLVAFLGLQLQAWWLPYLIPASDPLAAQLKLWHTDRSLAHRFHAAMDGAVHRVVPPVQQLSAALGVPLRPGQHAYIPDTEKTVLLALTLAVFTAVFWAIVLGRPRSSRADTGKAAPPAVTDVDAPAAGAPSVPAPSDPFVTPPTARSSLDKARASSERSSSWRDKVQPVAVNASPKVGGTSPTGGTPGSQRPPFGSSQPRDLHMD